MGQSLRLSIGLAVAMVVVGLLLSWRFASISPATDLAAKKDISPIIVGSSCSAWDLPILEDAPPGEVTNRRPLEVGDAAEFGGVYFGNEATLLLLCNRIGSLLDPPPALQLDSQRLMFGGLQSFLDPSGNRQDVYIFPPMAHFADAESGVATALIGESELATFEVPEADPDRQPSAQLCTIQALAGNSVAVRSCSRHLILLDWSLDCVTDSRDPLVFLDATQTRHPEELSVFLFRESSTEEGLILSFAVQQFSSEFLELTASVGDCHRTTRLSRKPSDPDSADG